VGPRVGLDAVVKRKIPSPCRDSNPRSSSPYPNAIPLSYPGTIIIIIIIIIKTTSTTITITTTLKWRQKGPLKSWCPTTTLDTFTTHKATCKLYATVNFVGNLRTPQLEM
jgi:hypothetical protein